VKKIYLFIFCIILLSFSFAQNKQQTSSNNFLGNYEGYQVSYIKEIFGRDVVVPGSNYSFKISSGNKINLFQNADYGVEVSYYGKYTISNRNNIIVLNCPMIEKKDKYPSKPTFEITFSKNENKVICQQLSDGTPSFELKKSTRQ
jgi:hypothetical protein